MTALRAENLTVPAGHYSEGTRDINVRTVGEFKNVDEIRNLIIATSADGSSVRLGDIAEVEDGYEELKTRIRSNGEASVAFDVVKQSGQNTVAVADAVKAKMSELAAFFPPGVQYEVSYDITPVIQASVKKVLMTLAEAVLLVFVVMYLFLQNIRYTLIPTIVVPIALLGTCAALLAMGFSINVLTMFGMVLAIGILVDDAIVVVENVERIMSEEGLSPRDATRKAMTQITGAIIGITLVLTAVFIPMAFFGGAVGAIYRQFTLSMVSSMLM